MAFAPNTSTASVSVSVTGDTLFEQDETFTLHLSNQSVGEYDPNKPDLIATIKNDDLQPTLSVKSLSVNEGQSGPSTANLNVSLSTATGQDVTFNYATMDGSALSGIDPNGTGGNDYVATSGTVTIPAGQTSATIAVTINGDTLFEKDENFSVNLTNVTGATPASITGSVTIKNDDNTPQLIIQDVTVKEGNSGTTPVVFQVTLSNPSALTSCFRKRRPFGSCAGRSSLCPSAGRMIGP